MQPEVQAQVLTVLANMCRFYVDHEALRQGAGQGDLSARQAEPGGRALHTLCELRVVAFRSFLC